MNASFTAWLKGHRRLAGHLLASVITRYPASWVDMLLVASLPEGFVEDMLLVVKADGKCRVVVRCSEMPS